MTNYMKEAYEEAKKAYEIDEVPVGCVIEYNDHIIARTHNMKETSKNAIAHAEILAIEEACKVIGDWRLNECTLYVTMEPCLMCAGALIQSRIKKVVYGCSNPKFGYVESIDHILKENSSNHMIEIEKEEAEEIVKLVRDFFHEKRS